jgi:GntR family transcriptional regulator/MocR family aminotransferase
MLLADMCGYADRNPTHGQRSDGAMLATVACVDVHVSLIGRKGLSREIYQQLRAAMLAGRLRPGDALPPTRELARRLNVSRGTVSAVYDRLTGEGFVTARVGAGTFVSDHVPHGRDPDTSSHGALRPRSIWTNVPVAAAFATPARYELRTGLPDATRFPFVTWRRLLGRELQPQVVGRGYYGDPAGEPSLRDAIVRHVGVSRGVAAKSDDVIVTNGTQQALDLVVRVLLVPGERVAVEDPGYKPSSRLFASHGLEVVGVPVDDDGLVVDALPPDARLVYVTPSHQYPLGTAMTLRRRSLLLDWADRHDAAVVEDDYDSEFRYDGRPIEPLQTLDASGRVIYVGSFSKTMLPTLRLGFVIAPPSLSSALRAAKYLSDWHAPVPTQAALASFINEGFLAHHIRRVRALYRARHEIITETIRGRFADELTLVPSAAGLHVSATATTATSHQIEATVQHARAAGVAVQPLSMFRIGQPPRAGLALGYGAIETRDLHEAMRRLHQALSSSITQRYR